MVCLISPFSLFPWFGPRFGGGQIIIQEVLRILLIKNGHVLDPCNQINQVTDVLIDGGKIARVGPMREPVDNTINASGCYVTPGLIDHHCHLYSLAKIGLPAEAVCFASGVTTAVDAGSTGCATYSEHCSFVQSSRLRIKAYLNVCSTGLSSLPVLEDVDPAHWDEGADQQLL